MSDERPVPVEISRPMSDATVSLSDLRVDVEHAIGRLRIALDRLDEARQFLDKAFDAVQTRINQE